MAFLLMPPNQTSVAPTVENCQTHSIVPKKQLTFRKMSWGVFSPDRVIKLPQASCWSTHSWFMTHKITKTAVDIQIDGVCLWREKRPFVKKVGSNVAHGADKSPHYTPNLHLSLLSCKPVICSWLRFCQLMPKWAEVCLSSETFCCLNHKLDWLCVFQLIPPEIMFISQRLKSKYT